MRELTVKKSPSGRGFVNVIGARTFDEDISKWVTDGVTDMDNMLRGAWAFNRPMGTWKTDRVATMRNVFYDAKSFNQNIDSWVTNKVSHRERA